MNINDYKQEIKDCVRERMQHCQNELLAHPEWEAEFLGRKLPDGCNTLPTNYGKFSNRSYQAMVEITNCDDMSKLTTTHYDQMVKACRKIDNYDVFVLIMDYMMMNYHNNNYLDNVVTNWAVAIRNRDI